MDKIIDDIVKRGVVNIIPGENALRKHLASHKKLNIYLGIDPTATRIHVGHAVPLRKLQTFVELGHNVTFLIGDFTALIGDTSDKDGERPVLTYEEIQENFKTYKKQAEKILDFSKIKVVHNSEWLQKLTFKDVVKLCQQFSVGDFVGRTLIRKRLDNGKRVGLHETLYPVMQGYDSYFMDTDIQIGGADQTFNMQAGRSLQKSLRDKESFVLVNDYLIGTDGRKMSKSWGNAIWLEDTPEEMYGKVMSLNDSVIENYLSLATSLPLDEVATLSLQAKSEPLNVKKILAKQIVTELHNEADAKTAQDHFEKTFQKQAPDFSKELPYQKTLVDFIIQEQPSKSQAKRLLLEGGVKVNGTPVRDMNYELSGGESITIGKKIFVTVKNPK